MKLLQHIPIQLITKIQWGGRNNIKTRLRKLQGLGSCVQHMARYVFVWCLGLR